MMMDEREKDEYHDDADEANYNEDQSYDHDEVVGENENKKEVEDERWNEGKNGICL